jgi:D-alanine-D-alanine ligase
MKKLRVGFCYNLYKDFPFQEGQPEDIGIEWSDEEYITIVKEGLEKAGFEVIDLGEPKKLLEENYRNQIDIVFSLAEMEGYRFREILVPTICELYKLPYLFAAPDAMLITADKHLSNLIVEKIGYSVPNWFLTKKVIKTLPNNLTFPLIVKPNAEGSSMGIFKQSVVNNYEELDTQIKRVTEGYKQPAMIQRFIQGQEITVGVIQENGITRAMHPLQTFSATEGQAMIFDAATKKDYKQNKKFVALTENDFIAKVQQHAITIFDVIGCADAARIDFRLQNGELYFIEINGLTDFHPQGAFCLSALNAGIDYINLLKTITLNAFQQ